MSERKCEQGTWFTKHDCTEYGSTSCPMFDSTVKCCVTDEDVAALWDTKCRWYAKRGDAR